MDPGGVEFCVQQWIPLKIPVGFPKVFTCSGDDVMWLSYQVHIQKVYRGKMTPLNDDFAVVVTSGVECDSPAATVHTAPSQADCFNKEEFNAVEGEMCIRRDIAVNTRGSHQNCFIVYCTNHRSDCELWARSFWKKYSTVFPSVQAIPIGTDYIMITGENLASDALRIKTKCMDQWGRVLPCNCSWVDSATGRLAKIQFDRPLQQKHTGRIYLRLDSDNAGWLKPVQIAVVTDTINPWISATLLTTLLLFGVAPTAVFCVYWRTKLKIGQSKLQKRRKAVLEAQRARLTVDQALQHRFHSLH